MKITAKYCSRRNRLADDDRFISEGLDETAADKLFNLIYY
jgi:hypothetical protein